ncbi:TolC family protein [bacterium]|nr:TolC family protein [bacterium]MBU1072070.1 TolC family protein [bacterium]MBU1676009.1 TolC family protein [bacterium]
MDSRRLKHFLIILLITTTAGCSTSRYEPARPQRRPLGLEMVVHEAPSEPDSPGALLPELQEPVDELSLRDALVLALRHNPKLAATSWNVRIGEARTRQAGLLPNPETEMGVAEAAGTGERRALAAAETSIRLSQLVELGDKRAARSRLAAAEGTLGAWDHEAMRLAVLTNATLGFIDVLAAQDRLRLAEDFLHLSEETFNVVAERVMAGKVSPLERTKAAIERADAKIELSRARSNLHASRQRLAATWGSTSPHFSLATGALDRVTEIPPYEAIKTLIQRNPEVARWTEEMEHRLAAIASARAARVPDLTVSAGAQHFSGSGDRAFTFGLSLPIPLFDRNQGGLAEARYRQAQSSHEKRYSEVQAVTALVESYEALSAARTEALGLREEIVPAADQAFEAARDGYQQGKFGYLDVLDAQRTFFEAKVGLLDALARYHRAVAIVESLVGTPLDALSETRKAETEERP